MIQVQLERSIAARRGVDVARPRIRLSPDNIIQRLRRLPSKCLFLNQVQNRRRDILKMLAQAAGIILMNLSSPARGDGLFVV